MAVGASSFEHRQRRSEDSENQTMNIPTEVTVHPIVLLSVVDHFNRVGNRRVVGALLGSTHKNEVEALNSYAGSYSFV